MFRPTYFVGIGDYGSKVIDMIKVLSFILTQDPTFSGIFRYHKVYWGRAEPGFAFKDIFRGNFQKIGNYDGAIPNRGAVNNGIDNVTGTVNAPPPVPDDALFGEINTGTPAIKYKLSESLKAHFKTDEAPLSNHVDIFVIANIGELAASVLAGRVAEEIRENTGTLPYGMLFIPDVEGGGIKPSYAKSFLYELYTRYSSGGSPWYEAVYLSHLGNLGGSEQARAYTTARFLILIQTIVDIPGKLVDISSDEGRGNVIAWGLRGVRFKGPETRLINALLTIEYFLEAWSFKGELPGGVSEDEISSVFDTLMKRLKSEDNTIISAPWPPGEAVSIDPFDILEKILRDIMWDKMFREDKPSGPAYARKLLDALVNETNVYQSSDEKLWDNWNPGAPADPGLGKFKKIKTWVDYAEKFGMSETVESIKNGYLSYIALGKWLNSGILKQNDFVVTQPSLGELLSFLNESKNQISASAGDLGNAIAGANNTGVWIMRGFAGGDMPPAANPDIAKNLILGKLPDGSDMVEEIDSVKRWEKLKDEETIVINPLRKVYSQLFDGGADAVPALGAIAGDLSTPFLKLNQGGNKFLYDGWIRKPEGSGGNTIPIAQVNENFYEIMFPSDYDYIVVRTDIGLSDINIPGDFDSIILADPNSEALKLKKFLFLFTIASFPIEWGATFGTPRYAVWNINDDQIVLGGDGVALLTLNNPANSPDDVFATINGMAIDTAIRNFIYNTLLPLIHGDAAVDDHLRKLIVGENGIGMSELGYYIQNKIFQLPLAPTDADNLVRNIKKSLLM